MLKKTGIAGGERTAELRMQLHLSAFFAEKRPEVGDRACNFEPNPVY